MSCKNDIEISELKKSNFLKQKLENNWCYSKVMQQKVNIYLKTRKI